MREKASLYKYFPRSLVNYRRDFSAAMRRQRMAGVIIFVVG
jgi:hypothetical protein